MKRLAEIKLGYLQPVIWVFVVTWISYWIYYQSRNFTTPFIHQTLAFAFGAIYFLSIFFSPFFIFASLYKKMIKTSHCILYASIIPFIWMVKGVFTLNESHPILECFYWTLNPLHIFYLCILIIELGGATLISRLILKRQGAQIKVFSTGALTAIVIGILIALGISVLIGGENVNSSYLEGYRYLFGYGT